MRIDDLFSPTQNIFLNTLKEQCSDFLQQSDNQPLLKSLPTQYNDFHKIKVRKRKFKQNTFTETFNDAFQSKWFSIRERAVFANGIKSYNSQHVYNQDDFYIFPIDGFKYIYSPEVQNSTQDYESVFDSIFEEFGSINGNAIIADLLKFTYVSTNLNEGIEQGAEIIIYNIPYFFAIRCSQFNDYNEIIDKLKG